jgi:hypothetical protein
MKVWNITFYSNFVLFNNGYIDTLYDRTVYIDYLNNQLRMEDEKDNINYISFRKIFDDEKV